MHPPPRPASQPPLGVILAGGASRRFGAPKALARVGGRRIVDRVREALAAAVPDVVVSANDPALFADLGLPMRADQVAGVGALGGIHTALRWAAERGASGALVVACDMPWISAQLLRTLVDRAASTTADAVVPESGGRRGMEPLCAWYSVRALPAVERMIAEGERRVHLLIGRVHTEVISIDDVRRTGDPGLLFMNVNTVDDLRRARRHGQPPPAVCIIGKKNSGKTTLAVALLAELRRRGVRVASIKHGHHAFETDQPGRDSWRHFNEGQAEATIMAGEGKIALVMRMDGEPDPVRLVRDFYTGRGYDLVLVEGYKAGPFPKIEVFRRAVHDRPLFAGAGDAADSYLAVVTDDASLQTELPTIVMDADHPDAHVRRVAEMIVARFVEGADDGG
ncbi:molybdopterin-guanine dinucleotide biosynthesis protein B [Longimicrobium sp.]|uniref:molybdopterin-guanine dinucleotide biosynthesis protein B n=1 Tax=Longimicrobium sp. TaxID=2029185 RepID=UPI003B3A05E7